MGTVSALAWSRNDSASARYTQGKTFQVSVRKEEGVSLGIAIKGQTGSAGEVVLCSISTHGILKKSWDDQHPGEELLPGYKIISANGVSGGVQEVAPELWKVGQINLELQNSGESEVPLKRTNSRIYLASAPRAKDFKLNGPVDEFDHLAAGQCRATECAICFEDLDPEERVVQLPCKHAFHPCCTAQWFSQGRRRCPLCVKAVDDDQES